jgi:hypothetical protein
MTAVFSSRAVSAIEVVTRPLQDEKRLFRNT